MASAGNETNRIAGGQAASMRVPRPMARQARCDGDDTAGEAVALALTSRKPALRPRTRLDGIFPRIHCIRKSMGASTTASPRRDSLPRMLHNVRAFGGDTMADIGRTGDLFISGSSAARAPHSCANQGFGGTNR